MNTSDKSRSRLRDDEMKTDFEAMVQCQSKTAPCYWYTTKLDRKLGASRWSVEYRLQIIVEQNARSPSDMLLAMVSKNAKGP